MSATVKIDATEAIALPLREIAQHLRTGGLSPVALAEASLDRLERHGPALNCVVTLTRERALAEARRAEAELKQGRDRGPLHGIPYGAKDLYATAGGIPTTWGIGALKEQRFGRDAACIERLESAGAVLVAKLAMVEVAGGMKYDQPNASFTGPGINPWNRGAWTGGSSSGSGSAVAARLVPYALGSETWGSILGPASLCGLSGLRPSFGRVSRRGAMVLSWTLDKVGPLAYGVDDCGLVLAALAGADAEDAACLDAPYAHATGLPKRRLRIGVLTPWDDGPQPEPIANFRAALDVLREFADLEDARLPDLPYTDAATLIMFSEAASAHSRYLLAGANRTLAAKETHAVPLAIREIPAADYVLALRVRQRMHREIGAWLARFDAVVAPTNKLVAPPLDARFSKYYGPHRRAELTTVGNLLGLPALSVPTGFGERGLPTAMQLVAAPLQEAIVVSLGEAYQARTDWHRQRPALA
jgi:aspartyl-tRNA(Asn)/glutamyl-tRNA(Gln) amidotransferase subunit A